MISSTLSLTKQKWKGVGGGICPVIAIMYDEFEG